MRQYEGCMALLHTRHYSITLTQRERCEARPAGYSPCSHLIRHRYMTVVTHETYICTSIKPHIFEIALLLCGKHTTFCAKMRVDVLIELRYGPDTKHLILPLFSSWPPLSLCVMLLSNSCEYPCEYENLKFAANSQTIIWLALRNTEEMRHYTWLRMLAIFLLVDQHRLWEF
jgi:hypothetical protein